jgi:activator of HSP90 ATPase
MPKRDSFVIASAFAVKSHLLYRAFLDSSVHAEFIGSPAEIDGRVGGSFTAWDGYISGTFLALAEDRSIKQSWRTTEFDEDDEDSIVEIDLVEEDGKTNLVLKHTNLPEGTGEEYRQGWIDYYLTPLREYYEQE